MTGSDKRLHGVRLAALALATVTVTLLGLGFYVDRVRQAKLEGLVARAEAQGLSLKLGQVDRSLFGAAVTGSSFTLKLASDAGVAFAGTIERLTLELSSDAVTAHGVKVHAQGEPLALFESWMSWADKVEARADGSSSFAWDDVGLSLAPGWGPRVVLTDVTGAREEQSQSFLAAQLSVGSLAWDGVVGSVEPRKKGLEVGFGSKTLSRAPVRWLYFRTPPASRMTLTVRPDNVGVLLDRSRIPLRNSRARQMRALSTLSLVLRDGEPTVRGTLGLTLDDFVHPELSQPGRLFGSTAAFFGRLETNRDLSAWQLPFMQATLPPFTLRGSGRLDGDGNGVRLRARLRGRGECARLATLLEPSPLRQKIQDAVEAAAESLPPMEVTLMLDIATRRLDQAGISWQIGAACGLPDLAQGPLRAMDLTTDTTP